MRTIDRRLEAAPGEDIAGIRPALALAIDALGEATSWMVETGAADLPHALAGSASYLKLMGIVTGGALLAQGALAAEARLKAGAGDAAFNKAKLMTARFFAEHVLATAPGLMPAITGGATTMSFDLERF